MTESISKHERTLSAVIHASTLSRFFIPLGNFLLPLVLWMANKKDLQFVDYNGKQALNFQISLLLYSLILGALAIPVFIGFMPGLLEGGLLDWHNFNTHFDFNFNFEVDYLNLSRFIWPVGIAGLFQAALFVINIVYTILATLRTNEGQHFHYPLTIKFIR
jgi:uncharacterized Tic20 family protein